MRCHWLAHVNFIQNRADVGLKSALGYFTLFCELLIYYKCLIFGFVFITTFIHAVKLEMFQMKELIIGLPIFNLHEEPLDDTSRL